MSKTLKMLLSLALAAALVLSLGIGAFAEESVTREFVGYGYGMPEEARVAMHGLDAEDITLDGVSYEVKTENAHLYIRLPDLAAAKLLRESRDKAGELGIDYAKLYIHRGLILVKASVPADEAAGLEEKLSLLRSGAVIGVSIGDVFDLGNGGVLKLQVEIADFVYPSATNGSGAGNAMPILTASIGNIEKHFTEDGALNSPVSTTTIFYVYFGSTALILGQPERVDLRPQDYLAVAYAPDDQNTYYVEVRYDDGGKAPMVEAKDLNSAPFPTICVPLSYYDTDADKQYIAEEAVIYTDDKGENEIRRIKPEYIPPKYDDFIKDGKATDTPPEGYYRPDPEQDMFLCSEPPAVNEESGGTAAIEAVGPVNIVSIS